MATTSIQVDYGYTEVNSSIFMQLIYVERTSTFLSLYILISNCKYTYQKEGHDVCPYP